MAENSAVSLSAASSQTQSPVGPPVSSSTPRPVAVGSNVSPATPVCQQAGKIRRKYKRLQQQQRHSPLSSKARCLLLSKLDASATSTPYTTSLMSASLMSASLMSTSLLSELDALLVKLKDYPGLHVEEFKDQDRGEGWIVVSR